MTLVNIDEEYLTDTEVKTTKKKKKCHGQKYLSEISSYLFIYMYYNTMIFRSYYVNILYNYEDELYMLNSK